MRTGRVRSALFTPGTERERLRKAVGSGADVCIFDLEDSVPASAIDQARVTVRESLHELGGRARIWIRVHGARHPAMAADVAAVPLDRVAALVLPKVDRAEDLAACRAAILHAGGSPDLPLIAIVESPAGVLACAAIAGAPHLRLLALGRFDLSAALGIEPDSDSPALAAARGAVVLASAAAGLPPPLDSPWVKIEDKDGLRRAAERGRRDGFGGMLLIHPAHVATVNQVFTPTRAEVEWAQSIVHTAAGAAAQGKGVFRQDGEMVDEAMVRRARAILEQADQGGS